MSTRLGRHIAGELAHRDAFGNTPRPIIDAVVEAVLARLDETQIRKAHEDGPVVPELCDLRLCEGACDTWYPEDELEELGEDGPSMCGQCRHGVLE